MLLVAGVGFGLTIVGLPGFQGYYTYHNMEEHYMSFAPLEGSKNRPVVEGEMPTRHIFEAGKPDMTKLIVVAVVYLAIIGSVGYFVLKPEIDKRWNRNDSTQRIYYYGCAWGFVIAAVFVWQWIVAPYLLHVYRTNLFMSIID